MVKPFDQARVGAAAKRASLPALALLALPLAIADARATDYPTQVQATANLVGYWRFEPDTQADSSVNGYTGTFLGNAGLGSAASGPPLSGLAGNSALVLDGLGDAVTTNLSSQDTFPTAATIVAWVWLNQQPSTDPDHNVYQIAARASVGDDMDFQINPDNHLYFFTDAGGSASTPDSLPIHQWVFVAGTFDTATATRKVYVDGRVAASNAPGAHTANSATFTIGYSAVWANRWFNGAIDEVAIFDRALSDAEIKGLFDAAGDVIFRSNFAY